MGLKLRMGLAVTGLALSSMCGVNMLAGVKVSHGDQDVHVQRTGILSIVLSIAVHIRLVLSVLGLCGHNRQHHGGHR